MFWFLLALLGIGQPETPRAFVLQVYAGYRSHDYNPLSRLDEVFAPELAAAIREDARLAGGEVGYLDGDPLCDCQDYLKLTAAIRSIRQPSRVKASAIVDVDLGVGQVRHLRIELVRTRAGWRIDDVVSGGRRSLLRDLQRSNRRR
jgi:hypothetical protein